jgi:hypothetical protein
VKEYRSERGKIDKRSESERKPQSDRINKEEERIIWQRRVQQIIERKKHSENKNFIFRRIDTEVTKAYNNTDNKN